MGGGVGWGGGGAGVRVCVASQCSVIQSEAITCRKSPLDGIVMWKRICNTKSIGGTVCVTQT